MNIARGIRQGFQKAIKINGDQIIVHNQWNTPDQTSVEVRGMKNTKTRTGGGNVFQFLDPVEEIQPGSVLQIKGARDLWKVEDTEDHTQDGTLIYFEASVVKINQEGSRVGSNTFARNVIHVGGDLNGPLQVDSHYSQQNVSYSSNDAVSEALIKVIEAIQSLKYDEDAKADAIHNLEQLQKLSKQEKTPDLFERAKKRFEAVQSFFKTAKEMGTDIAATVSPYLPAIQQYFGF